jgi:flagellar motor protein MotB
MKKQILPVMFYLAWGGFTSQIASAAPQNAADPKSGTVPIYHVTVVERTIRAINYQYRSGPTPIDFRGTVLLPKAKGSATVESKQGRTEIDVHFDNLTSSTAFGREYLTYVLWALTPDGRPHNMGEVIANSLDHAGLRVTTDLQAFAMIVTAEPYSAVRQPSDVVVLENEVRPDTTGISEQVNARYELLPRGQYSWQVPDSIEAAAAARNAPKVSTAEYEELLEIYQAQNAVGVARAAGADEYAHNTLQKAETLLTEAQQRHARKADRTLAIQEAREAAQTAEDARVIALQRQQQDKLVKAQAELESAQKARLDADAALELAQAAAAEARAQAETARLQLENERLARQIAEHETAAARDRSATLQAEVDAGRTRAEVAAPPPPAAAHDNTNPNTRAADRNRLLQELNRIAATRDTPRGLVVTIPDTAFRGAALRDFAASQVTRISQVLVAYPSLRLEVDGNSDSAAGGAEALQRAQAMGESLARHGINRSAVSVRGLADTRPLGPNSAAGGREQNRRVEILVAGDAIGTTPVWEQGYPLSSQR